MNLNFNQNIALLVFFGIIISACSKQDIPDVPIENDPVFTVQGTIDNKEINLQAGVNNAYMETKIQTLNNIDYSYSTLGNSTNSFAASFYSSAPDIPNLANEFNELTQYLIAENLTGNALLTIAPTDFQNSQYIQSIQWQVDGIDQNGNTLEIFEPGKYNICASVLFTNDSTITTVCNQVIVGYERNAQFDIKWTNNSNSVNCYIDQSNQNISSIDWYVNGTFATNSLSLDYNGTDDRIKVKALINFDNGAQYERTVFINRNDPNKSIEDWTNTSSSSQIVWNNTVKISLDIDGVTYESMQNSMNNAELTVQSIEDYSNTPKVVKKLIGQLQIPFQNKSTGQTVLSDLHLQIAVQK